MADLHAGLLDQLRHLLDEVRLLRPALERMPQALLTARPPGKWSVQETLGHLADMDAHVFQPRAEATSHEQQPTFENVDQDALVEAHRWNDRPLAEVLDALETSRRALLDTLEAIPAEDWDRAALWPDGERRTIADLAAYTVRHTHHHLRALGYFLWGVGGAGGG